MSVNQPVSLYLHIIENKVDSLVANMQQEIRRLVYPPQFILLKLQHSRHTALRGLESGVIPVKIISATFSVCIVGLYDFFFLLT